MKLVSIDAYPFFAGGVTIDSDNIIVDVPPLLRWSKGKDIKVLIGWLERKGWLRTWKVSHILRRTEKEKYNV